MQQDLDRNYPSSEFSILAINAIDASDARDVQSAAVINDLPLLQDTDENRNGNSDVWELWWTGEGPYDSREAWRDVHVVDSDGERTDVFDLTTHDLRIPNNYDELKSLMIDAATSRRVALSPWQNRVEPLDTNSDGFVAPNDVLHVINRINRSGAGELPTQLAVSDYYDVTGDNFVTALDVLTIIRHLNRVSGAGEPAGEPDSVPHTQTTNATTMAIDTYFAAAIAQEKERDETRKLEVGRLIQ